MTDTLPTELLQIQLWFNKHLGIPFKTDGSLAYDPPDGEYFIPLGEDPELFSVRIEKGAGYIEVSLGRNKAEGTP